MPFRLERRLTLVADLAQLRVDERISNTAAEPWECTWGHHLVLGPPFVAAGARFEPAAGTIVTIPEMYEDTARLEPGQRSAVARTRSCAPAAPSTCGELPGPEVAQPRRHVPDRPLRRHACASPTRRSAARCGWTGMPAVFKWLIAWMPFGGAEAMPLRGSYALGIEPWVAQRSLADAAAIGDALSVAGGASLETTLTVTMEAA